MQFYMHEEKRNARRMEDVSSLFGKMNSHWQDEFTSKFEPQGSEKRGNSNKN
jgi:hypothetical protein